MKAYNDIYISDVSENVGAMLEYAFHFDVGVEKFWEYFINSYIANGIESANPKYLAGYSGREYFNMVLELYKGNDYWKIFGEYRINFDKYYWAGWAIAQFQQKSGYSFRQINKSLPIKRVIEIYPVLHEADISKFFDVADTYFKD